MMIIYMEESLSEDKNSRNIFEIPSIFSIVFTFH